jgi:hypothetical protein
VFYVVTNAECTDNYGRRSILRLCTINVSVSPHFSCPNLLTGFPLNFILRSTYKSFLVLKGLFISANCKCHFIFDIGTLVINARTVLIQGTYFI